MINKKIIHIRLFSTFLVLKLSANKENTAYTVGLNETVIEGEPDILWLSICFIKETQLMWTGGGLYNGHDSYTKKLVDEMLDHILLRKTYDLTKASDVIVGDNIRFDETSKTTFISGKLSLTLPKIATYNIIVTISNKEAGCTADVNGTSYAVGNVLNVIVKNTQLVEITFSSEVEVTSVAYYQVVNTTVLSEFVNDMGYIDESYLEPIYTELGNKLEGTVEGDTLILSTKTYE